MSQPEVRRIRRDDVERLRTIRLAALGGAPEAFGSRFEDEARQPPEWWLARAVERASGHGGANFLAIDDGDAVGIVGVFREPDRDAVHQLTSMWVEPEHRATGLADRLVDEVLAFARSAGSSAVELWVTVGNDRARRFYERVGFEPLDEFTPLPSDPCRDEQRMRLDLA